MHRAGSSNAAALFLALSLTTIAARVAVATGHLRPASPTWPFAIATVGALVVAGATGSAAGLVVGAAVLGVAQGLSLPACARRVVEHVPADRQRAAMAVSTIALDAGFILAGAAFGPVADAWGLSAVFAATAVACALATASSGAADRTLFDRIPLKENHVATR
jgi:MFS family permease